MITKQKKRLRRLWLLLVVPIAIAAVLLWPEKKRAEPVTVYDGAENIIITPVEGLPANPFTAEDFSVVADGTVSFVGTGYRALQGVDVSDWQGDIDWQQATDAGIQFAYIRCGYRRYGLGQLRTDACFEENYVGAAAAGLQRGIYFFSQATSVEEAQEEAAFVLSLLQGREVELPIIFDWETVEAEGARTAGMDGAAVSACAEAFCAAVESGGYETGIYLNLQQGYHTYDLQRFAERTLWLSDPGSTPVFYYQTALWQYDLSGTVAGIETNVDRDLLFVKEQ